MRTIKRYSNRKLYDTEEKRYITLDGIAELIREGQDIEVIENDTGEDLTAVTLSQIIFEQQKRSPSAPLGFFTNVIRFGNVSPLELLRRSMYLPGSAFNVIEKEIEKRLQELVEQGEMAEEQMRRLRDDLMSRFHENEKGSQEKEDSLLGRLNLPTRSDVQDLSQRLDLLTRRLDELVESRRTRAPIEEEEAVPPPDPKA